MDASKKEQRDLDESSYHCTFTGGLFGIFQDESSPYEGVIVGEDGTNVNGKLMVF